MRAPPLGGRPISPGAGAASGAHPGVSGEEEAVMAKGQKRGNREIRKPKTEKPKEPLAAPANSGLAMVSAINAPKKKK